jgi:GT2 family glycosyltransferase
MQSYSIIIVTWNALNHLKTFLPSVVKTDHASYEIILADNASTDESVNWVTQNYPQVRIATLDKNYGYCGGNNRATKFARYENLIFLNNDVEVTSDWLKPIDRMLNRSSKIGAIQPKIRSWQDRDRFEYAGAAGGFLDKHGFPFCRGRIFDTVEVDSGQYDNDIPIFWASGAALVVRKTLFNDVGGFEESFQYHMEEIDLCWRLQRMGKEVWYCHESVVYHLGGGSLSFDNPLKTYYNFRNNLMMLARNLPSRGLFIRILFRLDLDGLAGLHYLRRGQIRNVIAVIRAHFAFYKRISTIRRYRKNQKNELHTFIPLTELSGTWNNSIIWNYFILRRKIFSDLKKDSPVL